MEEFYSPLVSAGPNLWSRFTGVVGYASMGWESAGKVSSRFKRRIKSMATMNIAKPVAVNRMP